MKIRDQLQLDTELVESHGGVFEIRVNGELIHSKKATGLFPTDDFVLRDIAEKISPSD